MYFVCTWMPNEEVLGMVYFIIICIINFGAFVKLLVGIIVVVVYIGLCRRAASNYRLAPREWHTVQYNEMK